MRVNLSLDLGSNVVIRLFQDIFGCELTLAGHDRFTVAIRESGDVASLLAQEVVDKPCRLEFPDQQERAATVEDVVHADDGILLKGRFVS